MLNVRKNPEFRRELLIDALTTLVLAGLGLIVSLWLSLGFLIAGLLFILLHAKMAARRYHALAKLSAELDRILHDESAPLIDESAEGELAILTSEIRKMTVRLRETAEQSQRDKVALSLGLADISHQLRTPLTSMNLTVSLLAKEKLPDDRRLALTRELKRELAHVDWLVETLLKLSKLDAGTVCFASEPISLSALIEAATQSLVIPIELRGQTLAVDAQDAVLSCDPAWSAEAIGNLVKNCMEHTPEGGTITVCGRQTPLYTEITVEDTGPGFDPEDLPHVFERFYRGKHASENSVGIGLALARAVLAAQNGTLRACNTPRGARFEARLYHTVI